MPNKCYCHRHSAGKYERGASFDHNHMKMQNSCVKCTIILSFISYLTCVNRWFQSIVCLTNHCLQSKRLSDHSTDMWFFSSPVHQTYKCLLLTAEYSDMAGEASVLCKISFCNLTWKCCQICRLLSVSQVLLDFTQSSPGARATVQEPSKKQASQWCSLSSWAWNQGLKARTRYARYHIQFHCQPLRPDDTHWVRLSLEPSMLINTLSNAYLWVTIYSPRLPFGSLN